MFEKFIERIPTWALGYIINGVASALTEEDLKMVDNWLEQSGYEIISPIDYDESFTHYPAFGLPSTVIECECLIRK